MVIRAHQRPLPSNVPGLRITVPLITHLVFKTAVFVSPVVSMKKTVLSHPHAATRQKKAAVLTAYSPSQQEHDSCGSRREAISCS